MQACTPCRLEGKVALIAGGASGIGASAAKSFAQHGAKVVVADIQDELGYSVVEHIGASNSSYVHCNVTDESHMKNGIDQTAANHGKLDMMFDNAGTVDAYKPRIVEKEKTDFERVLSVNITGVFLGIKLDAAHFMIPFPSRSGLISTASISSEIGGAGSQAYLLFKTYGGRAYKSCCGCAGAIWY